MNNYANENPRWPPFFQDGRHTLYNTVVYTFALISVPVSIWSWNLACTIYHCGHCRNWTIRYLESKMTAIFQDGRQPRFVHTCISHRVTWIYLYIRSYNCMFRHDCLCMYIKEIINHVIIIKKWMLIDIWNTRWRPFSKMVANCSYMWVIIQMIQHLLLVPNALRHHGLW